jgi:hypothetical protein
MYRVRRTRRLDHLMATDRPDPPARDEGLRRMLKWVFVALVLSVLFGAVVVELTIRWFS